MVIQWWIPSKIVRNFAPEAFAEGVRCSYFVRMQYRHPLQDDKVWRPTDKRKIYFGWILWWANQLFHSVTSVAFPFVMERRIRQERFSSFSSTSHYPITFILCHLVEDVCAMFWQSMSTILLLKMLPEQNIWWFSKAFTNEFAWFYQFIIKKAPLWCNKTKIDLMDPLLKSM